MPNTRETVEADEQEEILREIEETVSVGRTALSVEKPAGSSGIALPAAVNAGALVLIALAILFVPRFYDVSERRLVDPSVASSADTTGLFRALRQQADVQIQERETEIALLQQQYSKARNEREALRRDFDTRLKGRADELQAGLQLSIDAERKKLAASGQVDAAAETRLRELETRLQSERAAELQAYESRLQAETAGRERELADAEARFGKELRQRTDPLASEIERLTEQGKIQQTAQKNLSRSYDEAQAEIKRLETELRRLATEGDEAAASFRRELQDSKAITRQLQTAEASRIALRDRLESILRRYAATSPPPREDLASRSARLELLQAKVETRAILTQEPVRSAHPGLADRLDRFFLDSEAQYRDEGRRAGLAEAAELVDSLAARREARGLPAGDPDLKRLLERLRQLLR